MRHPFRALRTERAAALPVTLLITIIVLTVVYAIVSLASQDAVLSTRDAHVSAAFYAAESGIGTAETWLEAQDAFPSLVTHPFGEDPTSIGCGEYTVSIVYDSLHSSPTRPAYAVRSVGVCGSHTRAIEVVFVPQSFADFLYFTTIEHEPGGGNPCWFISSDVVDGPLHTNDQIAIFGNPAFGGDVTSGWGGADDNNQNHDPSFLYYNGDALNHIESAEPANAPHDNPTFTDGYELGGSMIEIPDVLKTLQDLAESGGVYLVTIAGNYDIVMSRTDPETGLPMYGYVSYSKNGSDWTDINLTNINGMIYVNGSANVSGVLDGCLTIATSSNLYIVDDVTYRDSDENGPLPDGSDILGLVSGSDVIIENNAPNQDDLEVHAALMALNQSFRVDGYNVGDPRGTLTVHGGIIQEFRGPVGTGYLNGEDVVVVTGYSKDYHYDERLYYMPPPGFFQTGSYKRLTWKEVQA